MTTGWQVKKARQRYTKQEWQRMTGLVAPLVVNPLTSGGLDTEEGMELRDEIIEEFSHDNAYMVPFMCRLRSDRSNGFDWAKAFIEEAAEAQVSTIHPSEVVDGISTAFDNGGLTGRAMQHVTTTMMGDGSRLYAYYLEDLFDDAVMATEWQVRAMEDD